MSEAKVLAEEYVSTSQKLARALRRLKSIREVIEELKGDDADYSVVEGGLKEIERILDA